jgi:hypothetical protein
MKWRPEVLIPDIYSMCDHSALLCVVVGSKTFMWKATAWNMCNIKYMLYELQSVNLDFKDFIYARLCSSGKETCLAATEKG